MEYAAHPAAGEDVKLRVLLLEDLATDAELIEQELRRANVPCQFRRVEHEEEFISALDTFAPDIVLADYSLPQWTALDALRLVHRTHPTLPFILVTGAQSEEVAVECMREGADDYLLKSSLRRLSSAVLNAIKNRESERQRHEAEDALRRSEEQYRLITEHTEDLVCLVDDRGAFLYVSPSWSALLGDAPDTVIGTQVLARVYPDDRAAALRAIQQARPGRGDGSAVEWRYRHQNGEWRTFESVTGWIADQQEQRRAVIVSRDITARQRAEAQLKQANAHLAAREQTLLKVLDDLRRSHEELEAAHLRLIQAEKMDSVGRLAAGVAHEVKNPLTVILMGVEYLTKHLSTGKDSSIGSVLQDMHEAVSRANGAVRGLLDFSAPRDLHRDTGQLNDAVKQALSLVKHELAKAQVTTVPLLAPDLPLVSLDRNKMAQVFVNLFMNAIHAMPYGGTLTIRTSIKSMQSLNRRESGFEWENGQDTHQERLIVVEVEDTGIGIPPEKLAKIFEPFFTTKPSGKGTGLGLTVTQEIVHMHGGTIAIVNRPEGGVRVTMMFELPADRPSAAAPAPSRRRASGRGKGPGAHRLPARQTRPRRAAAVRLKG